MEISVQEKQVFCGSGGRAHDAALPWLVFLHGAAMDHTAWALQARYFAHRGHNVVAVDLPGHGRSEGPALKSVGEFADWLRDLLDALGADQAAFVGHSLGALAALEAAARYPERVSALGLLGIALPMAVSDALLSLSENNDHAAFELIMVYGLARQAQMGGNPTPGMWMIGNGLRLLERISPGVLHADFNAANSYDGGMEAAEKVQCPTMIIAGSEDRMTPVRGAKPVAGAIEGAALTVVEGSGHMMMIEAPDQIITALKEVI